MPDFARKLLAAYRGTPEETMDFWDELDCEDEQLSSRELVDPSQGPQLGYRATRLPQDQDDLEEEGRWR